LIEQNIGYICTEYNVENPILKN